MQVLRSWGANTHGQLGLGMSNEQVTSPTETMVKNTNCGIKQIACGGGHTILLTEEGQLYSCGGNFKLQLAHKEPTQLFERVWNLSGITFVNIACGWDFSCGVTDDKFLFVWGSNLYGQLGLPKTEFPDVIKPIRLQINACSVSMGLRHTAIINSKGEVWITGCGKHGQLGLGQEILKSDRFVKIPKVGKISHIACGQNHTTAWCAEENALYVWGDNRYGQLLLGFPNSFKKYQKIYTPQKIDIDVRQGVKKLLSGWTHVALWLEDGTLMTWGKNNYGQLGTEDPFVGKIIQIKLPGGREIRDVAVGSEHTICLATDNTLWAWGWNEHSNTGIKLGDTVMTPSLVPLDLDINTKITKIFAGSAHNFMLTTEYNSDSNHQLEEKSSLCL